MDSKGKAARTCATREYEESFSHTLTMTNRPGPPPKTKCPLTATLKAIGGKWNLICLYWLSLGTLRFNELRRLMPNISHKVLTATLRDLEREGLISRTVYPEIPPRVEYSISSHGETLRPLIEGVRVWGRDHLHWQEQEDGFSSTWTHSTIPEPSAPDRRSLTTNADGQS